MQTPMRIFHPFLDDARLASARLCRADQNLLSLTIAELRKIPCFLDIMPHAYSLTFVDCRPLSPYGVGTDEGVQWKTYGSEREEREAGKARGRCADCTCSSSRTGSRSWLLRVQIDKRRAT